MFSSTTGNAIHITWNLHYGRKIVVVSKFVYIRSALNISANIDGEVSLGILNTRFASGIFTASKIKVKNTLL